MLHYLVIFFYRLKAPQSRAFIFYEYSEVLIIDNYLKKNVLYPLDILYLLWYIKKRNRKVIIVGKTFLYILDIKFIFI